MRALYGRHYGARYLALDALIENGSSVVELCCGPAILYKRYLRKRGISYTGLDINPGFIAHLKNAGVEGHVLDLRGQSTLPQADYVIMQASLYHFLPDPKPVVDRMLAAARVGLIIAEPIRNLSDSKIGFVARMGSLLTNPGSGDQPLRFTESALDSFFDHYAETVEKSFLIPGGREKVYVLRTRDR